MTYYSITVKFNTHLIRTNWYLWRDYTEDCMFRKLNSLDVKVKEIKLVKLFTLKEGDSLKNMKSKTITEYFKRKYSSYLKEWKLFKEKSGDIKEVLEKWH